MSMLNRSPLWLTLGGVSTLTSAYLARKLSVESIIHYTRSLSRADLWHVIAIVIALLNFKNWPFVWHLRLFRGLLRHVSLSPKYCPPSPGPSALFQPVITSTFTPLMEMDYNLHKSNSTYFTDLDVSRMNHIACLFKRGLHKAYFKPRKNEDGSSRGKLGIMLGGVTCSFKKEIKPYESYEVWTRLLAWDRKWIYLVSHIVRKGVQPQGFTLQPNRKVKTKGTEGANGPLYGNGNGAANGTADRVPHKAIFATSISKYVFKAGRMTIAPEEVLIHSELLPPKPDSEVESQPRTTSPEGEPSAVDDAIVSALSHTSEGSKLESADSGSDVLSWESVERERARGMLMAQNFADLEDLHFEFTADKTPALGRY